jgi:hypothetical protein
VFRFDLIELRICERRRPVIRVARFRHCLVGVQDEFATHARLALERHLAGNVDRPARLDRRNRSRIRAARRRDHFQSRRRGIGLTDVFHRHNPKRGRLLNGFFEGEIAIAGVIAFAVDSEVNSAATVRNREKWIFMSASS